MNLSNSAAATSPRPGRATGTAVDAVGGAATVTVEAATAVVPVETIAAAATGGPARAAQVRVQAGLPGP